MIKLTSSNLLEFPGGRKSSDHSFAHFGDLTLTSAFQPIFSLSHRRSIGYEALLRARDGSGNNVYPPEVFERSSSIGRWNNLERGVQLMHASNFTRVATAQEWLFLNTRPDGFIVSDAYRHVVEDSLRRLHLSPERIVLEVLETPNGNLQRLIEGIASFRQKGFLIALDDFGAGHSNIDRVWQLQPDIVKLDRRVIEQAARSAHVARLLPKLISLLHEAGALVLVEGVETLREALLVMECDADFAQGFFFARPAPGGVDKAESRTVIDNLWQSYLTYAEEKNNEQAILLAAYATALQSTADRSIEGADSPSTCKDLLLLDGAVRCFILNAQGEQLGGDVSANGPGASSPGLSLGLIDPRGACWERRPYFKNAVEHPGVVQITKPYLSINGAHFCVTLSIAVLIRDVLKILCADIDWQRAAQRESVAA